ncbi:transcription factor RelB [Heteronotia binoei]|uniref:transcription factor RelB n=1 Tax=Heteronotia binoei TaxID=13085 RepID=UPI0029315C0D|nr:transcription factor RelB [Heteronotia binoei]
MSREMRKPKTEPVDLEEEEKGAQGELLRPEQRLEEGQLGDTAGENEEPGAALSASSLSVMQPTVETSEIIDELLKEDGFELGSAALPLQVPMNGLANLIRGCSGLASPTGVLRPIEPMGTSLSQLGLEPFETSSFSSSPVLLDSSASQLSQNLHHLTLVPRGTTSHPSPLSSRRPEISWPSPSCPPVEEDVRPPPKLMITEQPKQRGMRFRYQCEGRSAGSILGECSTETNKTLPAIELQNFEGNPEVKVTACLVWKDRPHRIHPHSLVGKDCHDGLCEVTLKPRINPKHSFNNLGIQCVKKKDIEESIDRKLHLGIDPFKAGSLKNHQEVDMNVVRICFQASYQDASGETRRLSPVLSEPIFDKKSTNTSELKIYRLNREYGSCAGGEELYMLCDKVQKEDISIVFRKDSWEAKADFSQADVHRQVAIVFKTPPYQHLDIVEPVEVEVYLRRLTDSVSSDPFSFLYLPKDNDTYRVNKKRKQGMPDVLEELSGPDPHGIEAKRKKKKPGYMDYFGMAPATAGPMTHLEDENYPYTLEHITLPPAFEDYSLLPDFSSYASPSLSDVLLPGAMDLPDEADHELLLDSYALHPGLSAPLPLSGESEPEGVASLVGSSLFPSQYKEAEAKAEMEAKLTAAGTLGNL